MLQWKTLCIECFVFVAIGFQGKFLVGLYVALLDIARFFSPYGVEPFCTLSSNIWECFSTVLWTECIVKLLNVHQIGTKWYVRVVLIRISLTKLSIEHHLIGLRSFMYLFLWIFHVFCPFFYWILILLIFKPTLGWLALYLSYK